MGNSSSTSDIDFELFVLLRHAIDSLHRVRSEELSAYGIPLRQAAVLNMVGLIGEKATPAEIARWLLRENHTISSILDRMEADGLIYKTKDMERRNWVRVRLTERGLRVRKQILVRQSIHKVMTCLSEDEKNQLRTYLRKIRGAALKEIRIDIPPFPKYERDAG